VNRFEGSFARGVPFQDNPVTNDCRISGTCASLTGLEQQDPLAVARILLLHSVTLSSGGIPLIYLGDEVGTLNDPSFTNDAGKAADSRWVHRPARDAKRYAQHLDTRSDAGRIYQGLRKMIDIRKRTPAFSGGQLTGIRTGNASVLGYLRLNTSGNVLVLCNFSEFSQRCDAEVFSAMPHAMCDLLSGDAIDTHQGVAIAPYAVHWLVAA
jgi:amylosucrase